MSAAENSRYTTSKMTERVSQRGEEMVEQHSRTRPSMTENVAIVIAARSVFQSRHITPLFSSEGGGVDKHGDTRRGNKSAAGAAECMNAKGGRDTMRTENALSRVNNLIRPCFLRGWERGGRVQRARRIPAGVAWSYYRRTQGMSRHRNCLRGRHHPYECGKGLRTKPSSDPSSSVYRLRTDGAAF